MGAGRAEPARARSSCSAALGSHPAAELCSMLSSTFAMDATARRARALTRLWRLQLGLALGACPGNSQRVLEQAGHRHGADAAGYWGEGTGHVNHLVEGHVADEAAPAFGGQHALDANVEDGGAGLDPVPAHHLG